MMHLYPIVKKNLLPLIMRHLFPPISRLKSLANQLIVERFETASSIQLGVKNEMYFCEYLNDNNLPITPVQETIKLATLDDIERIMQFRSNIIEFPTRLNC